MTIATTFASCALHSGRRAYRFIAPAMPSERMRASRAVALVAVAIAVAGLAASPAEAGLVTINPQQTFRFNVDMSSLTPTPPYTKVQFLSGLDFNLTVQGQSHIRFYGGLDGTNLLLTDPFVTFQDLFNYPLTAAEFTDGQFSVEVEVIAGTIVMGPSVIGVLETTRGQLQTEPLALEGQNVAPGESVPEPATASLLALAGLAAASAGRRRSAPKPARLGLQG